MRARAPAAMIGVLLLAAACTPACTGAARHAAPAPASPAAPLLYVAIGASESVGAGSTDPLRDAWTQIFYRTALPASAVFVNMAVSGSTLAQALVDQVPTAVSLAPQVVTVWLNVNDLTHAVPAASYESDLTKLVTALRRGGATTVLVANTPPLDDLPAYRACLPGAPTPAAAPKAAPACPAAVPGLVPPPAVLDGAVDAYNEAAARVTASSGAVLVDLHAAGLAARAGGAEASLVGSDGFHPSDAGHALVAKAFADAYRRAVSARP